MLLLFTFLLIIILISRLIETSTKIPATLSVIVFSFCLYWLFPDLLTISDEDFDEILYLMIPVILLPDILNISVETLKKHTKEILYLAVVAVVCSILIAMFITPYLLPQYTWSVGILLTLFSMLMATDAITVASIMSKFKLPEQLKMYAESESLFNDVTALIIFYFIALPMLKGDSLSVISVNITLIKVLVFSTIIGFAIAYVGYLAIKILKNPFDQFIIIYLIVITSFLAAEHFHIAGILSIVASVLTFKYFVQKDLNSKKLIEEVDESDIYKSILNLINKVPAITKKEFRGYKKEAIFIGIFANSIVFVILANIIDFSLIFKYSFEIFVVFIITTVIRFIAMYSMTATLKLPVRWAQALTFAGTKGALAVIMVHSIPAEFIYKELFESIVYGIVLITTFIYTVFLMVHIKKYQASYEQDILKYDSSQEVTQEDYTKSIIDIIEKDCVSGALNKQFIEDSLEKEIARVQRYKNDLSMISFKLSIDDIDDEIFSKIGTTVQNMIRINDYFGKLQTDQFVIITVNTSISGAIVLANKLYDKFETNINKNIYFGVTQIEDNDNIDSIEERLNDAILRSKQEDGEKIEVEV